MPRIAVIIPPKEEEDPQAARIAELEAKVALLSERELALIAYRSEKMKASCERKAREALEATKWADELGLPELTGSPRQTVWAEVLRRNIFAEVLEIPNREFAGRVQQLITKMADSQFWIAIRPEEHKGESILRRLRRESNTRVLPELAALIEGLYLDEVQKSLDQDLQQHLSICVTQVRSEQLRRQKVMAEAPSLQLVHCVMRGESVHGSTALIGINSKSGGST
jgi:hypothetical protein